METTEVVYQERKIVVKIKWLVVLLLSLARAVSVAQSTSPISFQYSNPRNGKTESAATFLSDFFLRSKSHNSECYYAMGWYRFHVLRTGLIDSVAFNGDIYPELKELGEKRIRESQVYWQCSNCEKTGGNWLTIPVLVAFTSATECPSNPVYKQSLAFWDNLSKNQNSELIPLGKNEWLLAPMYATIMR